MNCVEMRRRVLAEGPQQKNTETLRHQRECPSCQRFMTRIQHFEQQLQAACAVSVPSSLESRIRLRHSFQRNYARPLQALAAGLLALGIGLSVWFGVVAVSLESAMAQHTKSHPLEMTDTPIVATAFEQVAAKIGISVVGNLEAVVLVEPCWLQGRKALHLLVSGGEERIEAYLAPNFRIDRGRERFIGGRVVYTLPAGEGTLGIVANSEHDARIGAEKLGQIKILDI